MPKTGLEGFEKMVKLKSISKRPRCPQCGAFLTPTKAGWHGTTGSDLAGTGIEYYCKKCGTI